MGRIESRQIAQSWSTSVVAVSFGSDGEVKDVGDVAVVDEKNGDEEDDEKEGEDEVGVIAMAMVVGVDGDAVLARVGDAINCICRADSDPCAEEDACSCARWLSSDVDGCVRE